MHNVPKLLVDCNPDVPLKPTPPLAERIAKAPTKHPGQFSQNIWQAETQPSMVLWQPERGAA